MTTQKLSDEESKGYEAGYGLSTRETVLLEAII